jgi:serine/threonine protein kinase
MTGIDLSRLEAGDKITGVRRNAEFRVERKLGEGSNGVVYLVTGGLPNDRYAIKICKPGADFTSEIALLRRIAPQTAQGKPVFITEDRCVDYGVYYVMAYIPSVSISDYIREHGQTHIFTLGYDLLSKLTLLHNQGFIFGDIKLSNILVDVKGRIELIDYGGVVAFGERLRQYTEIYDRQYWQCGERSADMGYDLFSFAMLIMQLSGAQLPGTGRIPLLPHNRTKADLLQELDMNPSLGPLVPVLKGMVRGEYAYSYHALTKWRTSIRRLGIIPSAVRRRKDNSLLSGVIIAAALIFITSIFLSALS